MRKGLLITGVALIVIAVAAFFAATYMVSSVIGHLKTVTLSPGGEVMVGTASPGSVLAVVYMDSLGKPLEAHTTAAGELKVGSYSGAYDVIYQPQSGVGTLYLVNNYSTPITVEYGSLTPTASIITGGLMVLAAIALGIIGVILAILGAVLKPRK